MTFDNEADLFNSWWGDQWAGFATGSVSLENGKMKADITSIGSASYSHQLFKEEFKLEQGKTYKVSFDDYTEAAGGKKINVNIGKALTSAPWFTNYAATQLIQLTNISETYSFEFTVTENTEDNLKMVFELGMVNGDATCSTVYFDNVSIVDAY